MDTFTFLNDLKPILWDGVMIIALIIFSNGVIQNIFALFQLAIAYRSLKRRNISPSALTSWWRKNEQTMPMSILVPAYNEQETITESVKSLLGLHYPNYEVIVINDGSKDNTLSVLIDHFKLTKVTRAVQKSISHNKIRSIYSSTIFSRLTVIDKSNGGKADALNAGINVSRYPLFCSVDADSILESDSLLRAVEPFIEAPDKVVAVGGTIRIANGCNFVGGTITKIALPTNILALFQVLEYLRAFLMARLAWSEMGAVMMISGAFGIFKRSVAVEVGGYSTNTVGEDMEIIIKIHRYMRDKNRAYEIKFVPEPVCWTEAPESLKILKNQRVRWQRGTLETFFKHIDMLGKPKYGISGMFGFFYIFLADVLGPVLEFFGYILMPIFWYYGIINWEFFLSYLALSFIFGVFISTGSLILEELKLRRFPNPSDLIYLTMAAIFENFGYRQINNYWRFVGWYQYIRGKKEWGEMSRRGFDQPKQ